MDAWVRTSPAFTLGLDLQTALVNEVEGLDGVAPVDDARDVDLVRALADHLDVHVALAERCEHASGDTDHVPHELPDQRKDCHVAHDGDLSYEEKFTSGMYCDRGAWAGRKAVITYSAAFLELPHDAVEHLLV